MVKMASDKAAASESLRRTAVGTSQGLSDARTPWVAIFSILP
jgi:hypothetical protein